MLGEMDLASQRSELLGPAARCLGEQEARRRGGVPGRGGILPGEVLGVRSWPARCAAGAGRRATCAAGAGGEVPGRAGSGYPGWRGARDAGRDSFPATSWAIPIFFEFQTDRFEGV